MGRLALLIAPLLLASAFAGCAARGDDDPFAYMRKPLYASSYDLADAPIDDRFWVSDGSIAQVQVQVWVNVTEGDARVRVIDPAGHVSIDTTASTMQRFALRLGEWRVEVEASEGAVGEVGILATRT